MKIEKNKIQSTPSTLTLEGVQVLLVEDEPDMAELFVLILEDLGAEVILVDSACKALSIMENQHPDILVSNLRLPDESGKWLIQQIRKLEASWQRPLPAIAVTSYTREVNSDNLVEAGFHRFMPKPLDPDELVAAVLKLTGRAG
ncbi:response regulator [Oculatella sp. LEGE 06141]|uniref:response regulator n=1 Tax=Oculatella sp. LEGE 06141 TaxID=1828648 RepID=UPI00188123D2|nr:response regulator [Oculatella sp. LEGE 06141]MBE9182995.1 response regulator [Oculatella sp. LEGE 06141]